MHFSSVFFFAKKNSTLITVKRDDMFFFWLREVYTGATKPKLNGYMWNFLGNNNSGQLRRFAKLKKKIAFKFRQGNSHRLGYQFKFPWRTDCF